MERFAILAFQNSCGKHVRVSFRTHLSGARLKELAELLGRLDGVNEADGNVPDNHSVSVEVARSYDIYEVAPQVFCAIAGFLGADLNEVEFSTGEMDAIGLIPARPLFTAAQELFNSQASWTEVEMIARRIKLRNEANDVDLARYDELKNNCVSA